MNTDFFLICVYPCKSVSHLKNMDAIRVLIADDHLLFRDGLRALIASAPDCELVGEATTGQEVVALAAELQPDVILMDVKMPTLDGIQATRQIVHTSPHVGILVLTMLEDDNSVFTAMRAGARGYLLKGAGHDEILRAIRAVAVGQAIFSPAIATRMMDFFNTMRPSPAPDIFPELTARERELLSLIAQGHNNAVIAAKLVISPKTVSNHITNILSKLQVADRAEAIIKAHEAGL
jgi:DNA-binding NarL/FixJ family response regulator